MMLQPCALMPRSRNETCNQWMLHRVLLVLAGGEGGKCLLHDRDGT